MMMENHYKSGEKAISQISGHYYKDIYLSFLVVYSLDTFYISFLKPYTTEKCHKRFSCNFLGVSSTFFSYFDPTITIFFT